jgi:hypothetical protein
MKSLSLQAALATSASLSFCLGLFNPTVAQSATFNFSYEFANGETIVGMVDGDINPNNSNQVINLSNLMATYSELNNVVFNTLGSGSLFFTLDGTGSINLTGNDGQSAFFGINYSSLNNVGGATLTAGAITNVDSSVTFDRSRFQASPKSIPESETSTALMVLGFIVLGNEVRKKRFTTTKK